MTRTALAAAALVAALALLCLPASAQTLLFSDSLENGGASNWTTYSGCTPLQYVPVATDPNCNHTVEGSHGLKLTNGSDRVYRNVNLSAYAGTSVRFSLWFYDFMDTRAYSFDSFDIRNAISTQVLGMGAWAYNRSDQYYQCRVLTAASGASGPNWVPTTILRTVGWHHFEIVQYRGTSAGTVEFYVDGVLGNRNTNALDRTLDQMVLGLGWSGNQYQPGYVDDISYSAIPEPSCLIALVTGVLCLPVLTRRRRA